MVVSSISFDERSQHTKKMTNKTKARFEAACILNDIDPGADDAFEQLQAVLEAKKVTKSDDKAKDKKGVSGKTILIVVGAIAALIILVFGINKLRTSEKEVVSAPPEMSIGEVRAELEAEYAAKAAAEAKARAEAEKLAAVETSRANEMRILRDSIDSAQAQAAEAKAASAANEKALAEAKAEAEAIAQKAIADAEALAAEKVATSIGVPQPQNAPNDLVVSQGWSEEIRTTNDLKANNVDWDKVGKWKFPMAKNLKGLPSPIFGDSAPLWIQNSPNWDYVGYTLPNGKVVQAWALPVS